MAKILWASETGNCEEISRMIHEESQVRRIHCERYCLGEIGSSFDLTSEEVLVFVIPSTGDGEMPDNGLKFFRWLRQLEGQVFAGLRFCILGLGDSNYTTYQGNPKNVERLLLKLGAASFYERGEADEQCGLENVVEVWIDGLWDELPKEIEALSKRREKPVALQAEVQETPNVVGRILAKNELTGPEAVKKVVELTISTEGHSYIPGTAILVHPQNDPVEVDGVMAKLKLDPIISITEKTLFSESLHSRLTLPLSLKEAIVRYVDLKFPVKTRCAKLLAESLDEPEKSNLLGEIEEGKISMKEGFSLAEIAEKYNTWHIDIDLLLNSFNVLSTRSYSISSDPQVCPDSIKIAFTVTGVCTRYLAQSPEHVQYSLNTENGVFWEAIEKSDKVLMVSTGTGISPFRGILERMRQTSPKPVLLIHGCRNSDRQSPMFDFIYMEDVNAFLKDLGGEIKVANSKGEGKKYVQDIIEDIPSLAEYPYALLCGSFDIQAMKELLTRKGVQNVVSEEWE